MGSPPRGASSPGGSPIESRTASTPLPTASTTLRSVAASAFLPALVYEIGNGATAPVIALSALGLGASPGRAGFIVALLGIGQVIGDVPSSLLADRLGDRKAMMLAAGATIVALVACVLAPSLVVLGMGLVVIGMCTATFYLARQSYLSEVVPAQFRARAMSTLGGSHRIGLFIGPFVGAAAIGVAGLRAAYVVAIVTSLAVVVLLAVIPDAERPVDHATAVRGGSVSPFTMLAVHWRLFVTLGLAVVAVGAVRAARQTVLPLWAAHIGLSPATTSIVFGIANAVDMALFYPAGKVMDQFGRLAIALPSMLILAVSMFVLPLTGQIVSLTLVAMLMSLGNGIGSGMMMTLGVDVAPADGRLRFLSMWRMLGDVGNAIGPVVVAVVASAWVLGAGIVAIGTAGMLAAAGLAAWAPKYSPYSTRAMTRAHRAVIAARADRDSAGVGN